MPVLEIWILVLCIGFAYMGYLIKVKKKIGLIAGIENPKNYDNDTRDRISNRFGGGLIVLSIAIASIVILNSFLRLLSPFYMIIVIAILFFTFFVFVSFSFKK